MSDPLNERLNKILPRVISDEFLSGSGIGNEIAFYIFDYPPEDELRVRDYLRTLLDHIPKQKHGLRVKHIDLFDFVLDYLKSVRVRRSAGYFLRAWRRGWMRSCSVLRRASISQRWLGWAARQRSGRKASSNGGWLTSIVGSLVKRSYR